ncbi:hypothetical protein J3Q64DRAFT_1693632 [Phycomyces blakesleeanus]|uniref:Uncharacterized protein n=1 Tax=Phycomyces blakesleeanus TaxID=4837 RepID=A0ABR3BFX4_PHYBL
MFLLIKRYFVKRKKTKCDYNVKENFFIYLCEHKDIEIYSPKKYKCYLKQVLVLDRNMRHFTPSVLRHPHFFSYKNRYNSQFPVIPPLPPGFLSVVLGFRHAQCFLAHVFFVFYAQLPFHCSHGEVLHVKFMYQCPVSSAVLLLSTSTFLNPTQLSASVQCPVPSCFLAQLLTTILLMVPSYHVWSTECVQSMLMERCTENQLSILHPSQLTARTLDIGSPDFVLWGMSRLSQKGAKLDMRDEPEAKLRCLSKCYAVHLGVSDTCPEQFGIKAFHRYFAVMYMNEYFNTIFSIKIRSNFLLQASILGLADLLSLANSCLKTYKYKALADNMLDSQSKGLYLIGDFTSFRCLTVECSGSLRTIQ